MSLIQLAKHAFFNFPQLKEARKIGLGKIIAYILLLSSLSAIPITFQVLQIFKDIQTDGQEIAKQIPDFSIADGKLKTDNAEKGFIYQTNSIIFTFDPEGRRTPEDVSKDMVGNFLSVGLLSEELIISLPSNDATTSILGSNQFKLLYTDLTDANLLNGKMLRNMLASQQLPWWVFIVIFIVALYPSFLSLIASILIATLFGNIYCRFRQVRYSFLDNLKIATLCVTLPVVVATIVHALTYTFDSSTFVLLSTLFIFTRAVRPEKNIT